MIFVLLISMYSFQHNSSLLCNSRVYERKSSFEVVTFLFHPPARQLLEDYVTHFYFYEILLCHGPAYTTKTNHTLKFKSIQKHKIILVANPHTVVNTHDWFPYVLSVNIGQIFFIVFKPSLNGIVHVRLTYLCRVCLRSTTNGQIAIAVELNATIDLSAEYSLPNLLETFEDTSIMEEMCLLNFSNTMVKSIIPIIFIQK